MTFPPPNPSTINTANPSLPRERQWTAHIDPAIPLYSEEALSFRLLYYYGNRVRYFLNNDQSYYCDPATDLWAPAKKGFVVLAQHLTEDLEREAIYLEPMAPQDADEVRGLAMRLSSRLAFVESVAKRAQTMESPYLHTTGYQALTASPSDFFRAEASNEITCTDGRIKMTPDGIERLRAAQPQDGLLRALPYSIDDVLTDEPSEMYMSTLNMFMPDPEVREFFLLRLGTNALGKGFKRGLLILLYGTGRNGKTTLIRAALQALGDYAAPDQTLEFFVTDKRKSHNMDHMTFAYGLDGKRAATHAHEVEAGAMLFESNLKNAIPMQSMDQRKMRENERIKLDLQASFYMAANTRPRVERADRATRRRFACIAMSTSVEEHVDERNDYAEVIVKSEGAKVAGLQIHQACEYLRQSEGGVKKSIFMPAKIIEATEDWFSSIDPIAEFYAEYMRPSKREQVSHEAIYHAYLSYYNTTMGGTLWSSPLKPEDVLHHLDRAKYARGKRGRITDEAGSRRVQYVWGRLLDAQAANACLPYDDEFEPFFEEKLENMLTAANIETDFDSPEYWDAHDHCRRQYPQSYFEQMLFPEEVDSPAV